MGSNQKGGEGLSRYLKTAQIEYLQLRMKEKIQARKKLQVRKRSERWKTRSWENLLMRSGN